MLYDSGANIFAINRKYVPKSTYTRSYVCCCTLSGRVKHFGQCRMAIRMPFYTGVVLLCALQKPIADIMVGQMSRVKICTCHEILALYKKNGITNNTIFVRCSDKQITHLPSSLDHEAHAVMTWGERCQHDQWLQQERKEYNRFEYHDEKDTPRLLSHRLTTIMEMENEIPGSLSWVNTQGTHDNVSVCHNVILGHNWGKNGM